MTDPIAALAALPDLPQKPLLARVVAELWQDPITMALWLGGSLARGKGDAYSDIDLRVAVPPDAFDSDTMPASARTLQETTVAALPIRFGADATLHHLLLNDGQIYDLFVQTTEREPTDETRLILACRDAAFGAKLAQGRDPVTQLPPADGETMRQIIANFWISQQKHLKVLYRGLPLLAWEGEHRLRQDLIRLWHALATGEDCGPMSAMTIHVLSPVGKAVQEFIGENTLPLLGRPLTNEADILASIALMQEEVARVGRLLAAQLAFDYPAAAEETVRQSGQQFRKTSSEFA